jgi:hypothetical protein
MAKCKVAKVEGQREEMMCYTKIPTIKKNSTKE